MSDNKWNIVLCARAYKSHRKYMSYVNSDAGADTLNDIGHRNMHSG